MSCSLNNLLVGVSSRGSAGLCLIRGGGFRGSQGQLQWRLQVTHKAVGGSYWRLEGRLPVGGGASKGMRQGVV